MTLLWSGTLDAVKAFMGGDHEVAHVQAQAVLADNGKCPTHYQVPGRRDQPPVTIPAVRAP